MRSSAASRRHRSTPSAAGTRTSRRPRTRRSAPCWHGGSGPDKQQSPPGCAAAAANRPGARSSADRRRIGLRPALRSDRQGRLRAAGRGVARHARVLPGARADHPAADRGTGLCAVAVEADWPTPTASTATCAARATTSMPRRRWRVSALPDLDVAQHGHGRVRRVAAGLQRLAAARRDKVGFYGLDLYSLRTSMKAVLRFWRRSIRRRRGGRERATPASTISARTSRLMASSPAPAGRDPVRRRRSAS